MSFQTFVPTYGYPTDGSFELPEGGVCFAGVPANPFNADLLNSKIAAENAAWQAQQELAALKAQQAAAEKAATKEEEEKSIKDMFFTIHPYNYGASERPNGKTGSVFFPNGSAVVDKDSIVKECGTDAGYPNAKLGIFEDMGDESLFVRVAAITYSTHSHLLARCCFIAAAALQRVKGNTEVATKWFKLGCEFRPYEEHATEMAQKWAESPKSKQSRADKAPEARKTHFRVQSKKDFPPLGSASKKAKAKKPNAVVASPTKPDPSTLSVKEKVDLFQASSEGSAQEALANSA